jgi:hypothetical protein
VLGDQRGGIGLEKSGDQLVAPPPATQIQASIVNPEKIRGILRKARI